MTSENRVSTFDERFENRLNRIVEEFELAQEGSAGVDVACFMPSADDPHYSSIGVELLRVDLQCRWERATPISLREYQRRYPDILRAHEKLTELAFEEYRTRRVAGQQVDPAEYETRYSIDTSGWPRISDGTAEMISASTSTVYERAESEGSTQQLGKQDLPRAGQRFRDFDLLCEYGTGTFAKVFLARQSELANRTVVLKITASRHNEANQLARLQHTNIVPVHSIHDESGIHAVCMPNFGPCTVNDALKQIRESKSVLIDGTVFSDAIMLRQTEIDETLNRCSAIEDDEVDESLADLDPHQHSQHQLLASASYANACVMICLQIAEALRYAHAQGIIHRDLKPANVLLANHGPVMLLDFNLSDELNETESSRSIVGGTLPYAAPEHLQSLISGERVGCESDLFSLGVILYELLSRRLPFPPRPGTKELTLREMIADRQGQVSSVRSFNPAVPRSLDAIVARLLAASTAERYKNADQICEDLQRHLDDRPLRFAADRSIAERAMKWSRRHPRMTSSASISIAAMALVALFAAAAFVQWRSARTAEALASVEKLQQALPQIRAYTSLPGSDRKLLERGLSIANDVITPLEQTMPRDGDSDAEFAVFLELLSRNGEASGSISEGLFLMANAHLLLAATQADSARIQSLEQAGKLNRRAASAASGSQEYAIERQADAIRQMKRQDGTGIANLSTGFPEDDFLTAVSLLRLHQIAEATSLLETLRERQPFDLSIWFLLGNCYAKAGRLSEAEACFTTCTLMWSEAHLGFFQRGICRLAMKQNREAEEDFTKTLELDPDFVSALINRAIARRAQGQYEAACEDLDRAIALNAPQTRIYFMRSELRKLLGDLPGAAQDYARGLETQPNDEQSFIRRGMALIRSKPERAIQDLEAAATLNPRSYQAHRTWAYVLGERLNHTEQAIEVLDRMIPWSPNPHAEIVSRGVTFSRLDDRAAAIADAEHALELSRDSKTVFQVACIYANTASSHASDAEKAIALLAEAISEDPKWRKTAKSDPDLATIRNHQKFKELIEAE